MVKGPRLKVFRTRIGFHDWVVAAPSQKAALKAWDIRENLFATGAAFIEQDVEAVELALKNPGVPMALELSAKKLQAAIKEANVVDLELRRPKAKLAPMPAKKADKDRTKLLAAESELMKHEKNAKRLRDEMKKKLREVEAEAEGLELRLERERRALETRVTRERRALE